MGANVLILFPCQVKRELGGDDDDAGAQRLVSEIRRQAELSAGVPLDERKDAKIKRVVPRPDGDEVEGMSVDGQMDKGKSLDALAHHCSGCPVNVGEENFGCYASVRYPIPEEVEQWLVGRVRPKRTVAGQTLLGVLDQNGIDGSVGASARRERGIFVAEKAPSRRVRVGLFKSREITADHLWELLLWLGAYPRNLMLDILVSLELVGTPDGAEASWESIVLDLFELPEGDDYDGLAHFFACLFGAMINGLAVQIDA